MADQNTKIEVSDILYILDHPWKITEKEWQLSTGTRKQSLDYINKHLELSHVDGYSQIWRTADQKPIAILGGFKSGDRQYETFFVASIHMNDYALKLSFEMRMILKQQSARYKGCMCKLYSTSEHPKQFTWFRFLGFKHNPEGDVGNTRCFEYMAPL